MRNPISKTASAWLASATIGLATFGAVIPGSADVYSGRNGQTPGAFSTTGAVVLGGSANGGVAAPESFTALYGPASQPTHQCYDMTQLRQKSGNTGYSAIERC